ncbi:hypothetical protein NDU88_006133 [Pleurodeles waltl]|uniref:Uncharacterized protein n=1 Tax=Pleurodeles waltl TaxID=8319 RepID=A0AAV7UKM7_PLEWA|nr:hypothetical protein NDU88_006133 [Pleurodeles waltl]
MRSAGATPIPRGLLPGVQGFMLEVAHKSKDRRALLDANRCRLCSGHSNPMLPVIWALSLACLVLAGPLRRGSVGWHGIEPVAAVRIAGRRP